MCEGLSPGYGRQTAGHYPCTSDHYSSTARLPMRFTARAITITSDYSLTISSDSRSLLLQPLGLPRYVTDMRKQKLSNTYSVTSCTQRWSPHTIPAWTSPCNSALHANLRLLSFLLNISSSCLKPNHSTTTVYRYHYSMQLLRSALTVSTNFRQPRVNRTFRLSS